MKRIAFVPLSAVPVFPPKPLRYKQRWWKRKVGVINHIISWKASSIHQTIDESTIVGVLKTSLRERDYYLIVEEITVGTI